MTATSPEHEIEQPVGDLAEGRAQQRRAVPAVLLEDALNVTEPPKFLDGVVGVASGAGAVAVTSWKRPALSTSAVPITEPSVPRPT
ncbi:MAG: hypothetical protein ACJ79R_23345 [Anaeromyxobacteraceae bacterium]